MKKTILTIIPARGGSKGVSKKNSKYISDLTLIEYSILGLLKSKLNTYIYVSTDCKDVIRICRKYPQVQIINRPKELCQDSSSSESAVIHSLDHFLKKNQFLPEITILRQCTSPFVFSSELDSAINKFNDENFDSLFSAKYFHGFIWDKNVKPINHNLSERKPRQEIKNNYIQEDGAFYILNTNKFVEKKHRFFDKIGYYILPDERSIDIDTEKDLQLAKLISKNKSILNEFS
jgi:CMP-N,N'-diacetyllegionaminic acid synthase